MTRGCQPALTFTSRAHSEHKGNEQVEQHPLPPLLIGERRDHMAERKVFLQGLGGINTALTANFQNVFSSVLLSEERDEEGPAWICRATSRTTAVLKGRGGER